MTLAFGNVENTDWKHTTGNATSISANLPSYSSGDLGVLVCYIDTSTATFSAISGWSATDGGTAAEGGVTIFTRSCDGSEGSTVTVAASSGGATNIQVIALKITGHNTTTPLNISAFASASGGANWNSPSITTTADGCLLFFAGGCREVSNASDTSIPSGTTLVDQLATAGSWLGLAYKTQTSAGSTGAQQWTNTANAKRAFSFAIAPASATGLSITSVDPSQIDSGESVTITGTGFGASQGSSTVKIGADTQAITTWNDTTIVFTASRGSQSMGAATLTVTKA